MKVYLSGGMRGDWQDHVKAAAPRHGYIDPREHGLTDPEHYTFWDLEGVRQADIVFAYWERDNPSGFGLALEVGYALGLGKRVILVDERQDKYGAIVRAAVHLMLRDSLDDGLVVLRALSHIAA